MMSFFFFIFFLNFLGNGIFLVLFLKMFFLFVFFNIYMNFCLFCFNLSVSFLICLLGNVEFELNEMNIIEFSGCLLSYFKYFLWLFKFFCLGIIIGLNGFMV